MKLQELLENGAEDRAYEEERQRKLDAEVDKTLVTKHEVRVGDKTVAGPFDTSTEAVAIKNDLNKKHPRSAGEHRDYASVYSYRTNPNTTKGQK